MKLTPMTSMVPGQILIVGFLLFELLKLFRSVWGNGTLDK